jgi:septum formation protein
VKVFSNREPIILASGSPRRRKYLDELGLSFSVYAVSIDETPFAGEDAVAFVTRMAREKAVVAGEKHGDKWIIAGDTVVCLEGRILGKPVDEQDASAMLMSLSGREHIVRTGLCLLHGGRNLVSSCSVETKVLFASFDMSVARAYVGSGEWTDKAGGYGIQGKGAFLVRAVSGSYTNVVGFPLHELLKMLSHYGVIEPCHF